MFYDIELIDVDPNIENFLFKKVSKKDLDKIKKALSVEGGLLEFSYASGEAVLDRKYIRGVMYTSSEEAKKSTLTENIENAKAVGKVKISKKAKIKKEAKK